MSISNEGCSIRMKYDKNKPQLCLIPPEALIEIAEIFGFGAEKYGMNNWRDDGGNTKFSRTYSSIQRHLNAFWMGEDNDPESGKNHLAHAITQLIILRIHQLEHPEMDDRYKKVQTEKPKLSMNLADLPSTGNYSDYNRPNTYLELAEKLGYNSGPTGKVPGRFLIKDISQDNKIVVDSTNLTSENVIESAYAWKMYLEATKPNKNSTRLEPNTNYIVEFYTGENDNA